MADQLDLFGFVGGPAPTLEEKPLTIEERFQQFHDRNPHVVQILAKAALRLQKQGIRRWGIAALFEVMRYEYAIKTQGEPFKLNNDFRALYARMLMQNYPELEGFFETRERKSVKGEDNQ